MKLVWIAIGGAIGTLARYALSGVVQKSMGSDFPWGTVAVNIAGCFLFGLVWALAVERFNLGGDARMVVLVGFMGAFTTFSTLMFETVQLARDAEWLLAALNLVLQNTLGALALIGGWFLGRLI